MRGERKVGSRGRWGRARRCVRTRERAKECCRIFFCPSMMVCVACSRELVKTHWKTQKLHLIVCCVMSRKRQKDKKWKSAVKAQISMLALPFCSSVCLSVGAKIMLCSNHAVNYRQQVPPDWTLSDHPIPTLLEYPHFPACVKSCSGLPRRKKDHSMEMWAGTNRIGFDSLDSLSSSWLEFYSTSLRASHFKNGVARGAASVYNWASRQQNILLSVESGIFPQRIQIPVIQRAHFTF